MNKQTSCQSDQTISVQIKEDYWKIHGLIWWQKSLFSSCINTQWLAGYFGCITSPNFFFSHDCKCWTAFFLCPQYRVVGVFLVWFIINCFKILFFAPWFKWMCHCHLGTSNKKAWTGTHSAQWARPNIFGSLSCSITRVISKFLLWTLLQTPTTHWELRSLLCQFSFSF